MVLNPKATLVLNNISYPDFINKNINLSVDLYDFSNIHTKEDRENIVNTVASICYQNIEEKDLYNKLIKMGHESPFEFVKLNKKFSLRDKSVNEILLMPKEEHKRYWAVVKVRCPIYVARQIMRHRTFSYMEISRRYVRENKKKYEFFITKNKIKHKTKEKKLISLLKKIYEFLNKEDKNASPEFKRQAMPVSGITEFFMMGDIFSFLNFFTQRLVSPGVQKETKIVASLIFDILLKYQKEFIENMLNEDVTEIKNWLTKCNPIFKDSRYELFDKLYDYYLEKERHTEFEKELEASKKKLKNFKRRLVTAY